MPTYEVYGQNGAHLIETDECGRVLADNPIPYSLGSAAVLAAAEHPQNPLYEKGVAAKNDDGKGPKKRVW